MTRRTASALVATAVLVGACSSGESRSGSGSSWPDLPDPTPATSSPAAPSSTAPVSRPTARVLATGLAVPWGVAFLPGGDALVSERDTHRIVRVTAGGTVTRVGTVPGVAPDSGEGGLLGLALSPTFASDRLVYAYLTSAEDNRVVRFTYSASAGLGDVDPVFTGIPSAGNHNGGRIAFGPDRLLYVTTGDALQADRAPDAGYLGGKVLRMTADGKPAPGNPDAGSVVWTRGHRNPQGLAFAPGGTVYEAEFGQNAQDEINALKAGADYGWPSVEGTRGSASGVTAPLLTFPTSAASPSGLAYHDGALWLAALGGQRLYRMTVAADGTVAQPQTLLAGDYGRLRTVAVAPDGSLWVTTSNRDGRGDPADTDDRIIRVTS